jgi:hypothetical protein
MGDRLGIRDVVDIFVGSLLASVKQMQKVCATEAQLYKHLSQPQQRAIGCAVQEKVLCTHGGTRTHNLRFRKPTPYPLGHAGTAVKLGWWQEHTDTDQCREKLDGKKKCASPGNRTRVARMGILHDTTTPATQLVLGLETPCACNS